MRWEPMIVTYVNRYDHVIKEMQRNWLPYFLDYACAFMPLKSNVNPDLTPDEIVYGKMIVVQQAQFFQRK